MTVAVTIENDLKSWMKKKGRVLTISQIDIKSCCIGYVDVDVSYKVPKTSNYDYIEQDGFSIYIQKGLNFKNNIVSIGLTGIGPFKQIYIDGFDRGTI